MGIVLIEAGWGIQRNPQGPGKADRGILRQSGQKRTGTTGKKVLKGLKKHTIVAILPKRTSTNVGTTSFLRYRIMLGLL
jgi:hypothetical protein